MYGGARNNGPADRLPLKYVSSLPLSFVKQCSPVSGTFIMYDEQKLHVDNNALFVVKDGLLIFSNLISTLYLYLLT